ncbi:MAG: nucleoside-specific outer membrane channel protein Tsx [Motiliproteus sp.]|jgi:nucleoside-specific outer membrane channel protein Tsx
MKKYKSISLKFVRTGLLGGVCLLASAAAPAEMLWSDFNLSLLKGSAYEVGDSDRTVFTAEHVSAHSWGDNFFFIDRLNSKDGFTESYFEVSPRLSLSYLSGSELSAGPVKDLLLASTWEAGQGFDNYLYGVGLNLDVPGFQYVGLNLYQVSNELWEDDQQLTLTWGYPFAIGSADFVYDGFVDWSSAQSDHASELNFTSQLKWNLGALLGTKAPVYVGVEYVNWTNKFGIQGVDEHNPNLMLQLHF